jgi:hypothetical protein
MRTVFRANMDTVGIGTITENGNEPALGMTSCRSSSGLCSPTSSTAGIPYVPALFQRHWVRLGGYAILIGLGVLGVIRFSSTVTELVA